MSRLKPRNKSGSRINNNPDTKHESPLFKISLGVGIISAAVATIVGLVSLLPKSKSSSKEDWPEIQSFKPIPKIKWPGKRREETTPTNNTALPPISKKSFLGIKTSGDQWNNNLTQKLAGLFTALGYETKETVSGAENNFTNIVSGTLTVKGPEEKKGAFNTILMEYSLELTLRFYNGSSTMPCAERMYPRKVDGNKSDDKENMIRQGVFLLIEQLRNEKSFPLCTTKN